MNRSRLLLGVASVLAGITALMVVLGAVFNLFFVVLAIPFGVAAYFLWFDATGRLGERIRSRARRAEEARRARQATGPAGAAGGRAGQRRPPDRGPDRGEARRVLGVEAGADEETIRRAYRDRVKEVHPDAPGGDEEAFKRVQDAYERLSE